MTATGIDPWPFTLAHFIVMGVFAALVIAGILWGMKLKRARRQAEEEFNAHRDAADVPAINATDTSPNPTPTAEAPAAVLTPTPAPVPVPTSSAPSAPAQDAPRQVAPDAPRAGDITQLKGLGPKLAATLADLGITRIDEIAAMTPADLDALDARLGAFRGRPARDRWAEQARLLTSGDRAAYEAEFGKLSG